MLVTGLIPVMLFTISLVLLASLAASLLERKLGWVRRALPNFYA